MLKWCGSRAVISSHEARHCCCSVLTLTMWLLRKIECDHDIKQSFHIIFHTRVAAGDRRADRPGDGDRRRRPTAAQLTTKRRGRATARSIDRASGQASDQAGGANKLLREQTIGDRVSCRTSRRNATADGAINRAMVKCNRNNRRKR